jgi:predicted cupin superfamily sugar epimerase
VFFNNYDLDDEIVKSLRQEAIRAAYYAKACDDAYRSAMNDLWKKRLRSRIKKWASENKPVPCVLAFRDGAADVLVVGIRIDYERKPQVVVKQKTKSGRWGKSTYEYNAEWAIDALTVTDT